MSRRSQRDLRAPVGWSTQIALLVLRAAALFGAETCRERYGRLAEGAVGLVLYWPVMFVEQRLEARQADILRLTAETAPRPVFDPSSAVVPLVFSIVARLRGLKVADATPPVALAQQIVGRDQPPPLVARGVSRGRCNHAVPRRAKSVGAHGINAGIRRSTSQVSGADRPPAEGRWAVRVLWHP